MDAIINAIPAILNAGSFWACLAAVLILMGAVLNTNPIKSKLDSYGLDWLRPLIMLIGAGLGGFASAAIAGGDLTADVLAGVTAGLGSGFLQKFIQEATD